jgi:hypothetical protein
LLTESEVERRFRKLVQSTTRNDESLQQAEELLESLRTESPLRHRLAQEIDDLRELSQT